jgi:hypothetical protein
MTRQTLLIDNRVHSGINNRGTNNALDYGNKLSRVNTFIVVDVMAYVYRDK